MNPETEQDVSAANSVGEARVKSPYLMHSYLNNPEATANAFDSQGYYKTGDLLYADAKGFFFFVDRIKEIIKYKGNQVRIADGVRLGQGRGVFAPRADREIPHVSGPGTRHPALFVGCCRSRPPSWRCCCWSTPA